MRMPNHATPKLPAMPISENSRMIDDLRELEAGQPEVEDDHDADEALEDQQELALLDQVGLAGLVDELRDVGHRLVHRQLLHAGVGRAGRTAGPSTQTTRPDSRMSWPVKPRKCAWWSEVGQLEVDLAARPVPVLGGRVGALGGGCVGALGGGRDRHSRGPREEECGRDQREQPQCGRPSPPASQDSIQHDHAPCWMTADDIKAAHRNQPAERRVNATHGPTRGGARPATRTAAGSWNAPGLLSHDPPGHGREPHGASAAL